MDEHFLVELARAVGAAGATAALVFALIASWRRSFLSTNCGWSVAIAAGSYLGWLVLGGRPGWPPLEAPDRFLAFVFPAFVGADLVTSFRSLPGWLRWSIRGAVAVAAGPVLLFGSSYLSDLAGPGSREWSPGMAAIILGSIGAALAGQWTLLERSAGEGQSSLAVASLIGALFGSSVTIMLSGSATAGLLGLPLAAAVGGSLVSSLIVRRASLEPCRVGAALGGLGGLLIIGRFFAELSTAHALLLFVAPAAVVLADRALTRLARKELSAGICLLLGGSLVLGVIVSAHATFTHDWPTAASAPTTERPAEELALPDRSGGGLARPDDLPPPPAFDEPISPPESGESGPGRL